jgi:hypothetical protein
MIGVHYRAHNSNYDWNVVSPFNSNGAAVGFGDGASTADFERILHNISIAFTSIDSNGKSFPLHRFFLASNSDEAKQYLIKKFPETVIISGDYSRNHPDGIYFALLEWLLLSESTLLINTYGSSFAVESAAVNMRPILGVWGGTLIAYNDVHLPYCGHIQYLSTYSRHGIDGSYREGTIDNREIKSRSVLLKVCSHFKDWGLHEVYCSINNDE